MIAGTIGNLVDRIVFGHVIDFIDIVPWFNFNVADASILMGIVVLRVRRAMCRLAGCFPNRVCKHSRPW